MSDILSVQNYSSVYHSVPGTKFWDMPAQPVLSHRLMTEAVNHNHHHQVHVLPSCVSTSPWCWTWSASFTMLAMVLSLTPTSLALGLPVHLFHFLHIQRHVQGNNLNIQDSFLAGSGHSLSGHLLHVHRLLLQANHLLPLQYSPALSLRVDGDSAVDGDIINTEQLLLAIDCGILHGMFYPHQNVVHHVRFHCGHQSPAQ